MNETERLGIQFITKLKQNIPLFVFAHLVYFDFTTSPFNLIIIIIVQCSEHIVRL